MPVKLSSKCTRCRGTNLEWGSINYASFLPANHTVGSLGAAIFGTACRDCGSITLAVDTAELAGIIKPPKQNRRRGFPVEPK